MTARESSEVWGRMAAERIPSTIPFAGDVWAYLAHDTKVLDLGCGIGRVYQELRDRGVGCYTGIDVNRRAIEAAQAAATESDDQTARFLVADARGLSFDDNEFDLVICQALLTVLPSAVDRTDVLSEARRVLRTGGVFYVAEFVRTPEIARYQERYERGKLDSMDAGTFAVTDERTGESLYEAHHFLPEELLGSLTDARYTILSTDYTWFPTRTGDQIRGMVVLARGK